MLRQIHERPRIIVNETLATCTDTIHRLRCKAGVDIRRLAACAYNSLSFALAEVTGRSYGGGVLELEPSEAENLLIPYDVAQNIDLNKLDELLRNNMPHKALDYCDQILLLDGLGMDLKEVTEFRLIWSNLCQRRAARKRRVDKK
jgi:adenine-specific DNA methylase